MSELLELNDFFRWNGVKTVLFERSEFTVLAMEYDKIILILCVSSLKHRMYNLLISTQCFNNT
ncbi:hypothetical protein CSC2_15760 [Clostridium zeae]|uniref:Uncharacterized protein n=1 Tax=Clostridium zeae TaxID=2759022 RepID=A0ABQ1E8K8_9CLOT|nr:hypothetical protein [Clostridium zeae]GFZ31050.1 hypothetical protein CSC2_15760 [Clostridium zeae]